jgi:hypothetical protein
MYSSSSEKHSVAAIYRKYGKCEFIKYSASVGNNDMQAYNKKSLTNGLFAEKAPRPRQYLSMTMHLDYPR